MYALVFDIYFSLSGLTSFCIIGSRFIYLIRTDSNVLLFNGGVIFHCVYVSQLLYPFICWWTSRLLPCSAAAAKSLQLCPTLCDPTDSSPPGSLIPGILQARTLEWVAISFPNAWKWKVKVKWLSRVRLLATPWTAAYQAPPSMMQKYVHQKAFIILFIITLFGIPPNRKQHKCLLTELTNKSQYIQTR